MSEQIIPEALKWLNITGLNIKKEKFYIRGNIMIIMSTIVFSLEFLRLLFNFSSIDILAGVIEVSAPVYLALIKILMLYRKRESLAKIIKQIEAFWPTDKFGQKLHDEVQKVCRTVKIAVCCYRWLAVITTSLIIPFKPLLSGNGGLPIDIWQPINLMVTPYYEITYIVESMVGYFACLVNVAIDSLFVAYITHVIAQFMILKYALKNIDMKKVESFDDETVCWLEMKKCIAYHNHLIDMVDQIQESHSFTFFNMFGSGTLTVIIDMYMVAYDGSIDLVRIIKYIFQCSFFVALLFAYCFTGNQLTHECLSVADAMYEAEWYYKPVPRIRTGVILVIVRAQKLTKLTAGGLMQLDLENFIKMLRLAFSFFTLIRTQAAKKNIIE